jgi:hypothetical protein
LVAFSAFLLNILGNDPLSNVRAKCFLDFPTLIFQGYLRGNGASASNFTGNQATLCQFDSETIVPPDV